MITPVARDQCEGGSVGVSFLVSVVRLTGEVPEAAVLYSVINLPLKLLKFLNFELVHEDFKLSQHCQKFQFTKSR